MQTVYQSDNTAILSFSIASPVCCTGGPQVRFSIGAGDRQALQPPLSSTLPISHDSVALFFDQMGKLFIGQCL